MNKLTITVGDTAPGFFDAFVAFMRAAGFAEKTIEDEFVPRGEGHSDGEGL